jgi:hypothetical protein
MALAIVFMFSSGFVNSIESEVEVTDVYKICHITHHVVNSDGERLATYVYESAIGDNESCADESANLASMSRNLYLQGTPSY